MRLYVPAMRIQIQEQEKLTNTPFEMALHPDPQWDKKLDPDPYWSKKLDPDPHWGKQLHLRIETHNTVSYVGYTIYIGKVGLWGKKAERLAGPEAKFLVPDWGI